MSKVLFTLYFSLLIAIAGSGQETGVLTGVLTDQYTGDPLFGVKVRAWEQGNAEAQKSSVFVALSDEDGIFSLDLPAGQYQASFSRYGLDKLEIPGIMVLANDTAILNTTLLPVEVAVAGVLVNTEPVYLEIQWTPSWPSIIEKSIDYGPVNDYFVFMNAGSQVAVKFDNNFDHVIGGRIFVGDGSLPGPFLGSDFLLRIYDDDGMGGLPGNTLFEDTVTVDQYGWVGLDSLDAFTSSDHYYLSMYQLNEAPECAPVVSTQYPANSSSLMKPGSYNWMPFPPGNAMIRAWISAPHDSIHVSSYRVGRFSNFDPNGDPQYGTLTELASTNNCFYNDNAFPGLPQGWYAYGIKALYNNGQYSPYRISGIVYNPDPCSPSFTIEQSDGSVSGTCHISMTGISLPFKNYSFLVQTPGTINLSPIKMGSYSISLYKPGYEKWMIDSVGLFSDTSINITLQETIYPIEDLKVNEYTGMLDWENDFVSQYEWQCPADSICHELITPELDLLGLNQWIMTVTYMTPLDNDPPILEYSTDHGRTWALLHEFPLQENWTTVDIDLVVFPNESEGSGIMFRLHDVYGAPYYTDISRIKVWLPSVRCHPEKYYITLDEMPEGQSDSTFYQSDNLENGQSYRAGVFAEYSTGTTDTAFVEFTYHELFPPEDLAWEEENDTLEFSWSVPSGSWNNDKAPGDYPDALNGYALTYHTSDHLYRFEIDGPATTSFRFEKPDCDSATAILTAVYDLSDFGYPGSQFESKPAGPLQIKFDGPVENEFFEDWSAISLIHNCWKMTGNGLSIEAGQGFPGAALIYQNPPSHYQVFLTSVPINIPESEDAQRLLECDLTLFAGGYSGYEIMEIHLQQAGSSYWDVVQEFSNSSGSFNWSHYSLDLSGYISSDEFRVRFKFEGIGAEPVQWKVDNIHLHRVCSGPTTLQAELTGENEVSLNWLANTATKSATSFEHYNIFRKTGQDGFSLLATTTDTFYLDYLKEGGRYSYRVNAAYNDNGILCTSSPSDSAWIVSTYDIPENDIHGRISVYPNPVNERLFIVSDEMIYGINLYNSLGICVLDMDKSGLNFKIDMKSLANGIYFLRIELENKDYNAKIIH